MRNGLWAASAAALSLAGCAAGPAPKTGFLGDYTHLEKVGKSDSLIEQRPDPGFDPAVYRAVSIDPTEVKVEGLAEADRAQLAAAFREALVERLGGSLPVVDAPGPQVLRVRTAIVSASKANVPVNVVTTLLVGAPPSHGGVAAEAEVLDGGTGRRIAALSWARRGAKVSQIGSSYTKLGEARVGLRAFANRLADLFSSKPPRDGGSR